MQSLKKGQAIIAIPEIKQDPWRIKDLQTEVLELFYK